MTRIAVIVAAGGSGSRMGGPVPKQFLPLAGRLVLMRTIERLAEALPGAHIVVSLPAAEQGRWEALRREYGCTVEHTVVAGGADRFHSVLAALEACGDCDLIAVHDGVRPLASVAMIRGVVAEAEKHGAAIPAVIPVDSYKMISEAGSTPVDRGQLRAVQTPQVFRAAMLRDSYHEAAAAIDPPHRRSGHGEVQANPPWAFPPDDSTVVEWAGNTVHICPGDQRNIKITTESDLIIAEALLKHE